MHGLLHSNLQKGTRQLKHALKSHQELKDIFEKSRKAAQKTIDIQGVKIGGENVLFRHEKTFLNPTALCVLLDCNAVDFGEKLKRVKDFEISILNNPRKVDLIILKNSGGKTYQNTISLEEFKNLPIKIISDEIFSKTAQKLKFIREKAIKEKDENFPILFVSISHKAPALLM